MQHSGSLLSLDSRVFGSAQLMTSENVIIAGKEPNVRHHREFAKTLKSLIDFRGFERVVLDFQHTEICFPDAIVPIVALAMRYRAEGIRFDLILPRQARLERLFVNSNWASLISPHKYPASNYAHDLNLPAAVYKDQDEQYSFVKAAIDRILKVTRHLERSHLRGLEWTLNEVSDNVLLHAESSIGGIAQLSIRPHSREIEFIVCDSGIGIPVSLRNGRNPEWSDFEALRQATLEGVTRGVGQGNGLFGTVQVSTKSGGAYSINSGFAYISGTRTGNQTGQQSELEFPGTSVVCAISYARPFALEQALTFKGRTHTPIDFMEQDYEGFEENKAVISLAAETISVGSRRSGFELRTKIENIARIADASRVVLDFANLPILSSSFADEAIAKLIANLGVEEFRRKFRLVNVERVNRQIIFRSVQQRLSEHSDKIFE